MRWVVVASLLLAGCATPEPEPEVRAAVAADLLSGLRMPAGPGWAGVHLKTDADFWTAAKPHRDGSSLSFHIDADYYIAGFASPGESPVFIGGGSSFILTWDADAGVEPEFEMFLLGGRDEAGFVAFTAGVPGVGAEVLPTITGSDGGGGFAWRAYVNETLVLSGEHGLVEFSESYGPAASTPVGAIASLRVTKATAQDSLAGPGLATFHASAVEVAGAGSWSYSLAAGNHSSSFDGPIAYPGGSAADAAPTLAWVSTDGGDIVLSFERQFTGSYTSNMGQLPRKSSFVFGCAWADVDLSLIGWTVRDQLPQDQVARRVLGLAPLP